MRGPRKRLTGHEVVTVMGEAAGSAQLKIFKIVQTDAGGFFGLTEWEGLPMAQLEAESSLRAVNSVCQPCQAAIYAKSFPVRPRPSLGDPARGSRFLQLATRSQARSRNCQFTP